MLSPETIQSAVERIVASAHPVRVVLFGSYARGTADDGSDVDFLVIKQEVADRGREMLDLYRAIGFIGAGVDVLVCSMLEAKRRGQIPGTVIHHALRDGRILYDTSR